MIIILLVVIQLALPADGGSILNVKKNCVFLNKLKRIKSIHMTNMEITDDWTMVELELRDETYPLTITLLAGHNRIPEKLIFMVAPGGQNFQNTFFTPVDRNMALYMLDNGYMVAGVTFREDKLPMEEIGPFLADWGMEKHRKDLRKVVKIIQRIIHLPYDMIGQAISAVTIMDYASHYSGRLDRIILLDTDSFDPVLQPDKFMYADMTYNALTQIMAGGVYADPFMDSMRDLIFAGVMYPDMDSGQSREFLGLPGNFTFGALLHFSMIYTASLPGLHTPLTGLPGEWVMIQGAAAGYYIPAYDPQYDAYGLSYTNPEDLAQIALYMGTGIIPIAYNRDVYAIQAQNGAYNIDWPGIGEEVVMINSEYSSGNQAYYGTLIREAGNEDVSLTVIPGYAYIDLLLSPYADTDVWHYIVEE
jgi:hypothetical protein